jgi:hypothetical protein
MPPHDGVHDYARVDVVNALGAEKFTLLVEPADESLENAKKSCDLGGNQCSVQNGNSSPIFRPGSR